MGWEQVINIRGENGKHVEMDVAGTMLRWRQTDGTAPGPWVPVFDLANLAGMVSVEWGSIINPPETYTPSAHGHAVADVSGLADTLAALADAVASVPGLVSTVDVHGERLDDLDTAVDGLVDEVAPVAGLTEAVSGLAAGKADKTDPRFTDARTPTAGSVTNAAVADGAAISADKTVDGVTRKAFTATERTKLAGIAGGATANASDAALRDRATHTGTQQAATISDFVSAVSAIVQTAIGAAPEALDTLAEIAEALNNDPDFAATMTTALAGKEPTVPNGTTGQFYRGDKAWVALTKATVGLSNVDNTADAAKPVSTAQAAAIDSRVPATRTVAGKALSADVTLAKGDVGLGNVNNTADADKPVSTAQAAAIATRAPLDHDHTIGDVTGLQDALDTIGDAPSFRVYETFADAPPLPVDTVVISRTGL